MVMKLPCLAIEWNSRNDLLAACLPLGWSMWGRNAAVVHDSAVGHVSGERKRELVMHVLFQLFAV